MAKAQVVGKVAKAAHEEAEKGKGKQAPGSRFFQMGGKTQPEKNLIEIGPVASPEVPQALGVPRKCPQRTSSGLSACGTPVDFGYITALGSERGKCYGKRQNCGGFWTETAGLGNFWAENRCSRVLGRFRHVSRVRALQADTGVVSTYACI